jgi:transcriptional regulator with XRE-family HTH domain
MGRKPRRKPQHLAAKLLAIRSGLGISQFQMARLLDSNLPHTRLSEYESGRREPNLLLVLRYARAAKVPVENLIDDELDLRLD